MASISVSGIAFAAPIVGLALLLAGIPDRAETMANPPATLDVVIQGIKSDNGVVRMAICPQKTGFPDCKERALKQSTLKIKNGGASVHFDGVPEGQYAISVFHDANANGKLDTVLGIPKEGFGFSRNPSIKPRAPRFDEAVVQVKGAGKVQITMRYLL